MTNDTQATNRADAANPVPSPPSASALRQLRPWIALPFGAAVVAALVAYAGPGALADAFRQADARFVALAACAYVAFFLVRGLRWAYLLRSAGAGEGGPGLPAALESLGWMVSTFVPFKAGDAVRAVLMARRRAIPLASVAGTIAMERALDLAGLALAASIGLGALALSGTSLPPQLAPVVAVAWMLPVLGLAGALALALMLRARARTHPLLRLLGQLLDGVLAVTRDPRRAGPAIAYTLGVKACQVLVGFFLLEAFVADVPLIALAVVPLFLLTFLLAFTPGHVGTYEASFVVVYGLVGLPVASLAVAAVAVHMTSIAIVTLLGSLSLAALTAASREIPVLAVPAPHGGPHTRLPPLARAGRGDEEATR